MAYLIAFALVGVMMAVGTIRMLLAGDRPRSAPRSHWQDVRFGPPAARA